MKFFSHPARGYTETIALFLPASVGKRMARSLSAAWILLAVCLLWGGKLALSQSVVINEFLAANTSGLADEDGTRSDWVELYNPGLVSVPLLGYGLTDDPSIPRQWVFPNVSLAPGGFLLVWASGKNRTSPALHTNFQLAREGDYIGLYAPDNTLVDGRAFGPQESNISLGRRPDGGSEWVFFDLVTPGSANSAVAIAPVPTFSVRGGFFSAAFDLVLSTTQSGASIRYTLDSALPSASSTLYSGPIRISSTRVVRARVFAAGHNPSKTVSHTYLFDSVGTLPTLSLVTDPKNLWDSATGIYANPHQEGDAWERPVSIEFFEGGTPAFRIDAGIRIHGGASRSHAKKSFRLYFSADYGTSRLVYPMFADKPIPSFKRLVLGAGANDGSTVPDTAFRNVWTMCRDPIMNRLARQAGETTIAQRPAKVYLNGERWGLYWINERIDEHFILDNLGESDIDLLKNQQEVKFGDATHWNQTTAFFNNNSLASSGNYATARSLMDVAQTATHYIIEMWGGNLDWPQNNTYQWRPRRVDGIWRWLMWDTDLTFGSPDWVPWDVNMYNHVNGGHIAGANWSTIHFRRLKDNAEWRNLFLNRAADLLNTTFTPGNVRNTINAVSSLLRPEIAFEIGRWGGSTSAWESNVTRLGSWTDTHDGYFWEQTRSFFGIGGRYTLTVSSPSGAGAVRVNTLSLTAYPWSGRYFDNVPLPLVAEPAPGWNFSHWEGGGLPASSSVTLVTPNDTTVRAVFVRAPGPVSNPNDVIINEFWNNDDGTVYPSLGNRPISGDWIELLVTNPAGVDLRGWRLTNNDTKSELDPQDTSDGSVIFPHHPALAALPRGTTILVLADPMEGQNGLHFGNDDLDPSDGRLVLMSGNGNLDAVTDPGFGIERENDALVLLSPGPTSVFSDDVGVDFVAEGTAVTPESFGVSVEGVAFRNPFSGIGADDGAYFTNDPSGGLSNDDGADPIADNLPGPGGWVADPPAAYTGDDPQSPETLLLSPGAINPGQLTTVVPTRTPTPQLGNLLRNPGFEDDGVSFVSPPMHWQQWTTYENPDGTLRATDWQGFVRVRTGTFCAGKYTEWGRPQHGFYQRVTAQAGARYRAAVWAYTRISEHTPAQVRLGISPSGSTSPTSGDIVWTSLQSFTSGYGELALRDANAVQATANQITVFLEIRQLVSAPPNAVFFDDAVLEQVSQAPTDTPQPTVTATPTRSATATPSHTATAAPTATPSHTLTNTPSATPTPPSSPTPTGTLTPTATGTEAPSGTPAGQAILSAW